MADYEADASDAVRVQEQEVGASVKPTEDLPGAGWHDYGSQRFIPTVTRVGEMRRKDRWTRQWRG